jgi:rRNA maturation RNase YbeY
VPVAIQLNRLDDWPGLGGIEDLLTDAARLTVAAATDLAGAEEVTGELSITFLEEREIREFNLRYLDRDDSTDVIAFELDAEDRFLGDVYIAPDVAARNAESIGVDFVEEVTRLVIHGVLHVLGHDHPEDESREASEMFRLQEELLGRLRRG